MHIKSGPFEGHQVALTELQRRADEGGIIYLWPVSHRLRVFRSWALARGEQWDITIERKLMEVQLHDAALSAQLGKPATSPTALFVAHLSCNGQHVEERSSLCLLNAEKSWEAGETNAVSRLLDAFGLPAVIHPVELGSLPSAQDRSPSIAAPGAHPGIGPAPLPVDPLAMPAAVSVETQPAAVSVPPAEVQAPESDSTTSEPEATTEVQPEQQAEATSTEPESTPPTDAMPADLSDKEIKAWRGTISQIVLTSTAKGVDVRTDFKSLNEARQYLLSLTRGEIKKEQAA